MSLKIWAPGEQLAADDLNQNFTDVLPTALTLIPRSAIMDYTAGPASVTIAVNTTANLGQVIVPFEITANKITFSCTAVTTPGTVDLSLYSEDGQTRLFSVTTATISGQGLVTTALPSVVIPPGVYYIAINPNGTASLSVRTFNNNIDPFSTTNGLQYDVAGEPVMQGTFAIAAGTPPATFTPSSITELAQTTLIFRLDN